MSIDLEEGEVIDTIEENVDNDSSVQLTYIIA